MGKIVSSLYPARVMLYPYMRHLPFPGFYYSVYKGKETQHMLYIEEFS